MLNDRDAYRIRTLIPKQISARSAYALILSEIALPHENMAFNGRASELARKSMDWMRQAYDQSRAGVKDLENAEDDLYNLIANRYKYLTGFYDLA